MTDDAFDDLEVGDAVRFAAWGKGKTKTVHRGPVVGFIEPGQGWETAFTESSLPAKGRFRGTYRPSKKRRVVVQVDRQSRTGRTLRPYYYAMTAHRVMGKS